MGEMRERLARAMYERGHAPAKWSDALAEMRADTLIIIDAVLAAIEAAGMVIVPREPSDAMKKAWQGPEPWDQDALEVWQAMIAAA